MGCSKHKRCENITLIYDDVISHEVVLGSFCTLHPQQYLIWYCKACIFREFRIFFFNREIFMKRNFSYHTYIYIYIYIMHDICPFEKNPCLKNLYSAKREKSMLYSMYYCMYFQKLMVLIKNPLRYC